MDVSRPSYDLQRHIEIVSEALPCKCPRREVRHKVDKRGRIRLRAQCPDCGRRWGNDLRYSVLKGVPPKSVPPWNYEAEQRFRAVFGPINAAVTNQLNRGRSIEWWRQYGEYLTSPEWQALRRRVIEAAGGVCAYCELRPAVQAHHETYERVGHELLEDLSAVCIECHERLHKSSGGGIEV